MTIVISQPPTTLLVLVMIVLSIVGAETAESDEWAGPEFVGKYCTDCHGPDVQESDFRLDRFADLSADERHQTWHQVWSKLSARTMPPEDAPQPSAAERKQLKAWITENFGEVHDPTDLDHWSLKSPTRPDVPSGETPNPIDAFILRKLHDRDLDHSPKADRRTLLRRVTLDLIGLLPSPEETQAFLNDPGDFDEAYGRVVDRLLRSPRYGERWAQHWLDVIRWAETVGFETNAERRDAWHYRDWVILSFNEDRPYDQFLSDQLIGDASGQDAALGFLVAGPANLPGQIGRDEEAMRQARQDELDEVIQTVSQSLFGLTVGCARCHDHKFDPISQRDYYAMQAIFAGLQYGYRRLRGPADDEWTAAVPQARDKLEKSKSELESLRQRMGLLPPVQNTHTDTFEPVATDAVRMEITATTSGPPSLYEFQIWSVESPDADPVNIALASGGAVPSASSFALANQTRHFDNLVDGSVDRRQAFPWVASVSGPAWIQIDLPDSTVIDRVTWHNGSSVPVDYEIKVRDPTSLSWSTVADTRRRLLRTDDRRQAKSISLTSVTSADVESIVGLLDRIRKQEKELQRLSAGPQTYAARFTDVSTPTRLLSRGDPMQPREEVVAAVPAILANDISPTEPSSEFERRRMLAEHLTRPDHPLTARVMVNRIWQHHFGTGLVATSSDFGRMGATPSHPQLLDWLAVKFVEDGWSIKAMHRLITTSDTYTQSSRPREEALRIDADSRLLWRYPPRRLDAESIRDSILFASGKLNQSMYGRGFDFFNQRGGLSDYTPKETFDQGGWRRMIYAHKIRMQSVDVFGAFDCPDAGQMTPRRNQSITPVQSLGLLNSPFVNRQATFFADRIVEESGGDLSDAIRLAFEVALTRPVTVDELDVLLELASQHGMDEVCRVILNTSEFVFLQ